MSKTKDRKCFLKEEVATGAKFVKQSKDQKEPIGSDNKSLTLTNQNCCCQDGGGEVRVGGGLWRKYKDTANGNNSFPKNGEERIDNRWRSGEAFFWYSRIYLSTFNCCYGLNCVLQN